jgi:hypothetical protein
MIERYGKPYVEVMIAGKGPFRFIVDTGTGADAFISPELADQLDLLSAGDAILDDPSHQGARRVPMVLVPSIELAGHTFFWVKAVRHAVSGEAGSCQGLLGFTLFRDYLLTLDFPRRQVMLASGSLTPDGEHNVLPFEVPEGVPITTLHVDDQPFRAQLDSGGSGLTLPETLAALQRWDVVPTPFATGITMTTRFEIKAAKLSGNVRIGRYTFDHPVVEIHPAFPLVNFGSPPMQNFAITFDQRNRLVRINAASQRLTLTVPPSPTRLTYQPAPNTTATRSNLVPVG